jgi:Tfp pilus assembly protein PilX
VTDRSARGGFALVLAVLAVVVVGGLIVATHVAVTLEHRMAMAAGARQRAFAATEHALWGSVAEWDESHSTLAPGAAVAKVVHAAGDSATITTVRLGEQMYWLVAEAAVGDARRRTGVNVLAFTDSTGSHARPVIRSWVDLH